MNPFGNPVFTPISVSFKDGQGNPITQITGGQSYTCTVTLNAAPTAGASAAMQYNYTGSPPTAVEGGLPEYAGEGKGLPTSNRGYIAIPAGSLSGSASEPTNAVMTNTYLVVIASIQGAGAFNTLLVTPV